MQQSVPRDDEHLRPEGVTDKTVEAVGKLSEAIEKIERARGRLYDFHQLIGGADIDIAEASRLLRNAGFTEGAELVEKEIVGRNVLPGRWTFQIVEEFDDGYYAEAKAVEKNLRDTLVCGRRHVYESEMKERNRSTGRLGHEARP